MARGQVTAEFTTDIRQGCAPLVVNNFTNLSTGNPAKFFWDFGNGNTSTQPNPGTIYFDPGSYTVKLVVEDANGKKDSVIKSNYITVNKIPEVNFSASSNSGCVPFTIGFTDLTDGGTGKISSWEWDFGDGTTSSAKAPTHTFNFEGDFTITLKAADNIGCGKVETKASFIHVIQFPKAGFTFGSVTNCKPPTTINFSNTSTGTYITSTTWKFGDGTTSSNPNPSHLYTRAGTFQATLVVVNQYGCVDSITTPIFIGSLTPDFSGPAAVCQDATANFVNTSSPAVVSSYWDFGDNTSSTNANPVKRFAAPGDYSVKLVNNFGACKDSIIKKITVLPKPGVDFSFTAPAASCKLPVNVSFSAQSATATSYLWDFGDKTNSTLAAPNHTYTTYGTFAAKLVVTAANGCSDSISKSNIVSIVPAKINSFNNLPFKGCVPHDQAFSANITSPEPVTAYLWNFGDGNTSTNATQAHRYAVAGSYSVSLQITTANGCTDNLVLPAAVTITAKPAAAFTASPRVACAYDSVQFTDLSSGTIDSRRWDFGDGKSSLATNTLHRYSDTGFFTVQLIVGSTSCYDTLTLKNHIYINPPIAKFTTTYDCSLPLTRQFQNNSVVAESNLWTFGDGAQSTGINPVHTYTSPGVYIVHLHVTNGGCYDDVADTIKVIDEQPGFTLDQNELCRNTTSVFTITNINPQNIATYSWDFGDNTPVLTKTTPAAVNHNYLTAGAFNPVLTVTDILGCVRIIKHPVAITVFGPKADFTNPNGVCLNSLVTFTDNSQPSDNHPITTWILNYGDGKADTATTPVFSHKYTIAKAYNVSLIVTDSYGCKDTLIKTNAITVTNAKASFSLSDSIFCNNSNIKFTNQSAGAKLTYQWNFGDGSAANTASPSHTYTSEATYSVSLVIKDSVGCVDSINKVNAVVIGNAKALFAVDDTVISCPPAQISFVNNSSYAASVKWIFDDGGVSNIVSPAHYFLTARTYHVKLITYGHGTCVDSTSKDIIVKGPSGSFTYSPILKCAPATVNFIEDATNYNKNFTFDFGDGTTTTTSEATISHVYKEPGKYLPKLFLIDTSLNCRIAIFGADTISASAASSHIKIYKNLFCDSAGAQFFDSSIVQYDTVASYLWTFGDGASSNLQNPFHNYIAPGVYPVHLVIKTNGGCGDSSVNTFVKVVKSPEVQVTGPSATCLYQPVTFSGSVQQDTSAIRWSWDFGNGNKYALAFPPAQAYAIANNYNVTATVTNSSGCIKSQTKILTVNPLPGLDAGIDSVICRGETITLHVSGADSYLWQSNPSLSCTTCANPVASPVDTSVFYVVTGTNAVTSCQKTDSVKIKVVQPVKLFGTTIDTLCLGQSKRLSVTGADNYSWSPAAGLSNAAISNPVAKPDTSTLYMVTGHDYRNCFTDVAYFPITVYPIPVFDIVQNNITIAAGSSVTLNTTSSADVLTWHWFPTSGLSCSDCTQPVAKPLNTIVYKAVATNKGGCTAEDKVTIQVICNNGNVYIPNTFSPNNDGSNDVFFPRGKGIAGVKRIQVFNRAGAVVFQKSNASINDPSAGWDGTFNGKPADADVFVYQLEVICETGQVFSFKGDITLIR